jgi:hypothetical protein
LKSCRAPPSSQRSTRPTLVGDALIARQGTKSRQTMTTRPTERGYITLHACFCLGARWTLNACLSVCAGRVNASGGGGWWGARGCPCLSRSATRSGDRCRRHDGDGFPPGGRVRCGRAFFGGRPRRGVVVASCRELAVRRQRQHAKAAVARKVLIATWHVLVLQQPFNASRPRGADAPVPANSSCVLADRNGPQGIEKPGRLPSDAVRSQAPKKS